MPSGALDEDRPDEDHRTSSNDGSLGGVRLEFDETFKPGRRWEKLVVMSDDEGGICELAVKVEPYTTTMAD